MVAAAAMRRSSTALGWMQCRRLASPAPASPIARLGGARSREEHVAGGIATIRFAGARRAAVSLSSDRIHEFIHAEMEYFAQREMNPLHLERIVRASTPGKVLRLVHAKLPYFFARRVKHIEKLEGWEKVPELVRLRDIFKNSFRELRMCNVEFETDADVDNCQEFNDVIYSIRKRHKPVTALLGEAMRKMSLEDKTRSTVFQKWADFFLLQRISTEMLTSHYVAIIEAGTSSPTSTIGIVDTKCNPGKVCEEAAAKVLQEFPEVSIQVQVTNCLESKTEIAFSYIPRYLSYILQELLLNSARATAQAIRSDGRGGKDDRPIVVTVCADQKQVAIRISDQAGGVPFDVHDKMWSYLFSTSDHPFQVYADGGSPLSGWGMGLPLGRLYAGYLSGKLELMNMPGIGVDAYLFLNRIALEDSGSAA